MSFKIVRIISGLILLSLAALLLISLLSYNSMDFYPGESPISPQRKMGNLLGPSGAWSSMVVINNFGYIGFAFVILIIIWGLGRVLSWRFDKLIKMTGYFFGWFFAFNILISGFFSFKIREIIGAFGVGLNNIFAVFGSFGAMLVTLIIFTLWVLLATGLGLRIPVQYISEHTRRLLNTLLVSKLKLSKLYQERQDEIDDYTERQDRIYRRTRIIENVPDYFSDEVFLVGKKAEELESVDIDRSSPGVPDIVFMSEIEQSRSKAKSEAYMDYEIAPDEKITSSDKSDKRRIEILDEYDIHVPGLLDVLGRRKTIKNEKSHDQEGFIDVPLPKESSRSDDNTSQVIHVNIPVKPKVSAQRHEDNYTPPEYPKSDVEESQTKTSDFIRQSEISTTSKEAKPDVEKAPDVSHDNELNKTIGDGAEAESKDLGNNIGIARTIKVPEPIEGTKIKLQESFFSLPPLSILRAQEYPKTHMTEIELNTMGKKLGDALGTYKIFGKIITVKPGPVITRFEFEPESGTRVSKVLALADDLKLSLKTKDVRIVGPLPGKGTVGIEIPNLQPEIVYIRSVLESSKYVDSKASLPIVLGKDVAGNTCVEDLTEMPHLLIAGATGSGKSVCINAIITSLLYKRNPSELRLLLLDPKRLELSIYNGIPYLLAPVVVDNKEAAAALKWVVEEMETRYKILAELHVRSLNEYYLLLKDKPYMGCKIPFIVVVIDELADLMMTVSSEIEEPIARLAQMARAVGIHIIIATQRPSVDVVTGLIKANFPSRIAFKVRSRVDSRTILDIQGAERLLGHGDMLFLSTGKSEPQRIHGSYVSTSESKKIVEYLCKFTNPQVTQVSFKEELAKRQAIRELDELFWEAAKVIVISQKGSASHLQRKLRVGYTRAASIIDQLEMMNVVGPFEGSKARKVFVESLEELDRIRREFQH